MAATSRGGGLSINLEARCDRGYLAWRIGGVGHQIGGMALRRHTRALIGAALSVALLALALRAADTRALAEALGRVRLDVALAVFAVAALSFVVRTLRWRILLTPLRVIPTRELFEPLMLGFAANAALPARAGEFTRAWLVARRYGVAFSGTLATVLVERLIDVLMLCLLFALVAWRVDLSGLPTLSYDARRIVPALGPPLYLAAAACALAALWIARRPRHRPERSGAERWGTTALLAAALALGGTAWAWRARTAALGGVYAIDAALLRGFVTKGAWLAVAAGAGIFFVLLGPGRRLASATIRLLPVGAEKRDRLLSLQTRIEEGLGSLKSPVLTGKAVLYTLLLWSLVAWTMQLMALGCPGMRSMTFLQGLGATVICAVAVMIPAAPGYWGTYEIGCVGAVFLFGLADRYEDALAYSLVVHFLQLLPSLLYGGYYLLRTGGRGARIEPAAASTAADENHG